LHPGLVVVTHLRRTVAVVVTHLRRTVAVVLRMIHGLTYRSATDSGGDQETETGRGNASNDRCTPGAGRSFVLAAGCLARIRFSKDRVAALRSSCCRVTVR
jgi:hypothetical protein